MKTKVNERVARLQRITSLGTAPPLVDLVAAAMRDSSPRVRSEALQIVVERRIESAFPMVEKLLRDRSEQVRIAAVRCLISFRERSSDSREKIRPLLKDKSFLVRIEVLEGLALLRDRGALASIAQLLADKHPLVRAYSARSIAALQRDSYIQAIQNALEVEKLDSARAGFLEGLFLLGKKEVFGDFLLLLQSADYRVRCSVSNALADMPLDERQMETAVKALTHAESAALGVADKSSIARSLARLREQQLKRRLSQSREERKQWKRGKL